MLSKLILAGLLLPAVAAAQGGAGTQGGTPVQSMQIAIWPEYDRPAALVILKGELASEAGLPATVSLRIPASSGGPTAVAYATQNTGPLLNLRYDRSEAAGFITLRFTVPERFFHVEFYDRFTTGTDERSYKYLWPGDLPVNSLEVAVQEPAGASNLSVQPALGDSAAAPDGLRYRSALLGPVKQGTPRSIEIRYTKTDPRTSVEILKLNAPTPDPQAAPANEMTDYSRLYLALGAAVLLLAGSGVVYFLWWRRRARPSVSAKAGGDFCSKCGSQATAGARFCSKCGAALA